MLEKVRKFVRNLRFKILGFALHFASSVQQLVDRHIGQFQLLDFGLGRLFCLANGAAKVTLKNT
jgi:hypothetical protein